MKSLMKSLVLFVAWTHLVTCLAPYSPCYGMNGDELLPSSPRRLSPSDAALSPGDVDLESGLRLPLPLEQNSWRKQLYQAPLLFVSSLFCPETDLEKAGKFYKQVGTSALEAVEKQCVQVSEEGLLYYAGSKVACLTKVLIKDPLSTIVNGGAILLGYTNVGETVPFIAPALSLLSNIRASLSVASCLPVPSSLTGRNVISTLRTVIVAGSIVYLISQVPGVGAHEFNSVAQAKQHYSGGPCPHDPWNELMIPASTCLHGGGSLEECQALIPSGQTHSDLYAFTRHPTQMAELDPVSVLKLHEGGETCIQTALKADSPVTQTCFEDISDPTIRIVSVIEGLPLGAVHQGLKPGQTIRHIGLQLVSGTGECGAFHETTSPSDLGEDAICVFTSLKSGGEVAQLCFNPHRPEALTLKRNDDVSLTFDDSDGKPFSLVIRKPQAQGLNIGPDVSVVVEDVKEQVLLVKSDDSLSERGSVKASPVSDVPCPGEAEPLTLWGAIKLAFNSWRSGKPPCAKEEL